jgi:hypothetical protein
MREFDQGRSRQRFHRRFRFLQRQFLQEDGLSFGEVLSEAFIAKGLRENALEWGDRDDDVEEYGAPIAERAVHSGDTVEGTVRVVAAKSSLPEHPLTITTGRDHVADLANALTMFGHPSGQQPVGRVRRCRYC